MDKKLIKIWTSSSKRAIVCSTLEQLVEKGITKLNITNATNMKAYLEDGTELDDEEVFEALPAGTVVYLWNEDGKKPWEDSANDSRNFEAVLETPPIASGSSEIVQYCDKLISPSPEKGLKFFAPWPADFQIPTSLFSESLEREAVSGKLSWASKTELLKIIAEEIFKYSTNPSPSQRDIVSRKLIREFPNLKSNIGEGHEGWSQKIYDRVKNEVRKRSIFSHKRKLLNKEGETSLTYSPKVQRTLAFEPAEIEVDNQAKEKMLMEMAKMPAYRCSEIIKEGLKVTYKERRNAINSNILMGDLKEIYPAMFTALGIKYDYNILYNMDVEERINSVLEKCSSAVEVYGRKKKKVDGSLYMSIEENRDNQVIKTIMLIPKILGENPEYLYQNFPSETGMRDFVHTLITPHLCVVGDAFSSSELYIVAERKILIECSNFIEGISTLIGLYFVINIEYPKEAIATYKFFESYVLKLQCKNLPGKLITFCKAL